MDDTGIARKLLVTGGRGQLGRAVAIRFASEMAGSTGKAAAWDLIALGRDHLDVSDRRAVHERITREKPAAIIHAAAMTDVDGCERDPAAAFRVNALGTLHVAEAAEAIGARLIAISTDFVFDGEKPSPYFEQDAPNPLSVYGESKLAGEQHALRVARGALVVRTAWLYGPGGRNFVDTILEIGESGKPLRVVADQAGSPTWAPDLADALARLVDAPLSGVVHAANAGHATRYELARRALDAAGLESARVEPVTSAEMPRPARRPRHAVLGSRVFAAAGIAPLRYWEDALADHIAARNGREAAKTSTRVDAKEQRS
jgi:dTDP-4-dehydrorhamnose reductase